MPALPITDIEWRPGIGLTFKTSDELAPPDEIIGQRRALAALGVGLEMSAEGYNLFVMGEEGSGRRRLVRELLGEAAAKRAAPNDWCYVDNFADERKPRAIELQRGLGREFKDRMARFVSDLQEALRTAFQGEEYRALQQVIEEEFRERNEKALESVEAEAKGLDLALMRTPVGFTFAAVKDGQIITPEVFRALTEAEQAAIGENIRAMDQKLQAALRQTPTWAYQAREKVRELNRRTAASAVDFLLESVRRAFAGHAEIVQFLDELKDDVLKNVDQIIATLGEPKAASADEIVTGHPFYRRYLVNLIVDHSNAKSAPVVFEDEPMLERLIGSIEHRAEMGTLQTDFHLIRPGALHRANGGYLILDARKVLTRPAVWESLKRSIYAHEIRLETVAQALGIVTTVSLEPEPIPLNVKIVLIGDRQIYYLLTSLDPEFGQLFKIAVDWEDSVKAENGQGDDYVRLLAAIASEAGLPPFTRAAIEHVLRFAARSAGERERYTMQLLKVQDILREAALYAARRGAKLVDAGDVEAAIDAQKDRLGRIPDLVRESIDNELIKIETDGAVVGQINGLSVSQIGNLAFGRPTRITARVGLGTGDVVDIEREVATGGPSHSKGVLILSGFLRARFGATRPLSLSASLVFEQSYGGVDGDSASLAETCALLSAIAQVPLLQNFALTGSMNQRGQVQAIGGVNEKIEGFFAVCEKRGLNGRHGVIIPASNVRHLVLEPRVVEAIRAEKFRIYSVDAIEEALQILSGLSAGEKRPDGSYPPETFFGKLEKRLAELDEARRAAQLKGVF